MTVFGPVPGSLLSVRGFGDKALRCFDVFFGAPLGGRTFAVLLRPRRRMRFDADVVHPDRKDPGVALRLVGRTGCAAPTGAAWA